MVRSRFWSVLGPDVLSDADLEAGLAYMTANHLPAAGPEADLTFADQLIVLRGTKAGLPLPESAKSQFDRRGFWPRLRALTQVCVSNGLLFFYIFV